MPLNKNANAPPTKYARKLPKYDFLYSGNINTTVDTASINTSIASKYDPNVNAIATKAADIADNAISLLFIYLQPPHKQLVKQSAQIAA